MSNANKTVELDALEWRAQCSSMNITNHISEPPKQLDVEIVNVTQYDPEWAFTHHTAGVAFFKGKLYAAYSRGYWGEDFPGQQMAISSSENFYKWSEPQVIAPATQGEFGETCIIPNRIGVIDGKLFATYCLCEFDANNFNENGEFDPALGGGRKDSLWRIYTEDGEHWSEPERISSIGSAVGLWRLQSGRWMGIYGCCASRSDEEQPDGFKWDYTFVDSEKNKNSIARCKAEGGNLTETTWYQSPDGVLHIIRRSDAGYVWNSESYDDGESWTEFYPTRFTADNSQFNFHHLPDGRPIAIGSPDCADGYVWDLFPLNLYTTKDGYHFNKAYTLRNEHYTLHQQGYSKGGEYGYMAMYNHDGYLYIFHSRKKEIMELVRVKIEDIE